MLFWNQHLLLLSEINIFLNLRVDVKSNFCFFFNTESNIFMVKNEVNFSKKYFSTLFNTPNQNRVCISWSVFDKVNFWPKIPST